jgi:hypothetical protein
MIAGKITLKLKHLDGIAVCGRTILHLGLLLSCNDVESFVCIGEISEMDVYEPMCKSQEHSLAIKNASFHCVQMPLTGCFESRYQQLWYHLWVPVVHEI